MDTVTLVLFWLLFFCAWIASGAITIGWLDARFFKRDVDTLGLKYAFVQKQKLSTIILSMIAAMLAGPFTIIVAYKIDPLRKRQHISS
jgi:ABC-type Fe3+ transport system permease subunit